MVGRGLFPWYLMDLNESEAARALIRSEAGSCSGTPWLVA